MILCSATQFHPTAVTQPRTIFWPNSNAPLPVHLPPPFLITQTFFRDIFLLLGRTYVDSLEITRGDKRVGSLVLAALPNYRKSLNSNHFGVLAQLVERLNGIFSPLVQRLVMPLPDVHVLTWTFRFRYVVATIL